MGSKVNSPVSAEVGHRHGPEEVARPLGEAVPGVGGLHHLRYDHRAQLDVLVDQGLLIRILRRQLRPAHGHQHLVHGHSLDLGKIISAAFPDLVDVEDLFVRLVDRVAVVQEHGDGAGRVHVGEVGRHLGLPAAAAGQQVVDFSWGQIVLI